MSLTDELGSIFSTLGDNLTAAIWDGLRGVPALVIGLILALVLLTKGVSAFKFGRRKPRDPQRLFNTAQRTVMMTRAGGRCEHNPFIGGRCRATATAADHIYPWSKGGLTVISNGQMLCTRHNSQKSNHIPSRFYIHRLERRRIRYFPAGADRRVSWR